MAFVKVFACTALDNNARSIRSQGRSEARRNVSPAKDQQREYCLLIPKVHITTSPRSHFEKLGAVSFYLVPTMYNTVCSHTCYFCPNRTSRPRDLHDRCQYRLGVTIGRALGSETDNWFLMPFQPYHNSHPAYNTAESRKPIRLHSEAETELARDVMQSYGGSGVARSLYFYRTGEVCKMPIPIYCHDDQLHRFASCVFELWRSLIDRYYGGWS
jgi:hypothetical protein